jgi:hypothetical protein
MRIRAFLSSGVSAAFSRLLPRPSRRPRARWTLWLTLTLVILMPSCSSATTSHSAPTTLSGRSLAFFGAQYSGSIRLDPSSGATYLLALPGMVNQTNKPIRILGGRFVETPRGIRQFPARSYSAVQFGGKYPLASTSGVTSENDFTRRTYAPATFIIPAHSRSTRFLVVPIKLATKKLPITLHKCDVTYLDRSKRKTKQSIECNFVIQVADAPPSASLGNADVSVENGSGAPISIKGCPFCGSRGVGLPAAPPGGGGAGVTWEVKIGERVMVTVTTQDGRVLQCSGSAKSPGLRFVVTTQTCLAS